MAVAAQPEPRSRQCRTTALAASSRLEAQLGMGVIPISISTASPCAEFTASPRAEAVQAWPRRVDVSFVFF